MNDLFFGALGKTNFHGGSRLFSTPHTLKIASEYSIDININRNFVTCSLDGKLWAYGSGTTYVIFAFKWNSEMSRLEQAAYINFRGEKIIARGLNWLLTPKSIIYTDDFEPYIFTSKLFDTSNSQARFLYSILRSAVVPASAWDKNNDNGNSEGWGFLNKENLQPMQQCYSFLPSLGDCFIINGFLLRTSYDKSPYNSMKLLRPLIPMDFGSTATYPENVYLVRKGNHLWGRGAKNIGRVFFLPAVFTEDGEPVEFYLSICPDYVPELNTDEMLHLAVTVAGNGSLYGFLADTDDTLSNSLCKHAENNNVFIINQGERQEFTGNIFFDTLNSSAIAISDEGAVFFRDEVLQLQCNALKQWFAPAEYISCITDNLICSSSDNFMLAADTSRGFLRTALNTKQLPLSARTYGNNQGKHFRLSMGDEKSTSNRKNIAVNHLECQEISPAIEWQHIYKNALSIKLLNIIDQPINLSGEIICNISQAAGVHDVIHREIPASGIRVQYAWDRRDSAGGIKRPDIIHNATVSFLTVEPDTGQPVYKTASISYDNVIPPSPWEHYSDIYYCTYFQEGTRIGRPHRIEVRNGMIGVVSSYIYADENEDPKDEEEYFTPLFSSESITLYNWTKESGNLTLKNFCLPNGKLDNLPDGCSSAAYAVFYNKSYGISFALHLPSLLYVNPYGQKSGIFSEAASLTISEYCKDNSALHFISDGNKTAVIRSDFYSDIFNSLKGDVSL